MSEQERGDRGVSPVVGVILMVAVTVVVASVAGTVVMGAASSIKATDSTPDADASPPTTPVPNSQPEPASETNITLIEAEAALVLGGVLCIVLVGRSSRFWTSVNYARAAIHTRMESRHDDSLTPVEEIKLQYENREIDEATMERRIEDAMETDPTLAGVPAASSNDDSSD